MVRLIDLSNVNGQSDREHHRRQLKCSRGVIILKKEQYWGSKSSWDGLGIIIPVMVNSLLFEAYK